MQSGLRCKHESGPSEPLDGYPAVDMQSGLRCKRESGPSEPLDGYPAVDYNLTLKPPITTL
jgi:hypothetical protein